MPGSIERRGKSWRARYRDPTGRQRTRSFTRKLDAQLWLAAVEIGKSRGEWIDPSLGRVTVGAWTKEWFGNLAHLKPSTRARYDVAIRHQILPAWEHVPLKAVSHGDVVRWARQLTDAGLAAATVRYAYRVFSQAMAAAVRDNRIAKNPAADVKLPRIYPTEKVFLDHGQVEALAQACGSYGTFIRFLAYTGLRWGEATAVRVRRLDAMRGRLEVTEAASEFSGAVTIGTPKSHQRRSVPLPAFLISELEEQIRGKGPTT